MTWLWIPHASSWSSTYECVGLLRTFHPLLTSCFTFQHLPAFVFCLFCVVVWFCCFGVFLFPVFALLCFWFLFCKCLGIPNSPRSLDLDDRQGLIARSAMQQKKKKSFSCPLLFGHTVLSLVVWTPFSIFINFSIYYPLFYIIGPACHCGRSRLSPSSTFPTPFSLHPTGPACHCGRSRLSPSSTFPTPFPLPPTGPACHCGRSRLFPFLSLL